MQLHVTALSGTQQFEVLTSSYLLGHGGVAGDKEGEDRGRAWTEGEGGGLQTNQEKGEVGVVMGVRVGVAMSRVARRSGRREERGRVAS